MITHHLHYKIANCQPIFELVAQSQCYGSLMKLELPLWLATLLWSMEEVFVPFQTDAGNFENQLLYNSELKSRVRYNFCRFIIAFIIR